MEVFLLFDEAEKQIAKPEGIDCTGIVTNHMRVMWGLRDALNEYFIRKAKGEK